MKQHLVRKNELTKEPCAYDHEDEARKPPRQLWRQVRSRALCDGGGAIPFFFPAYP